MHHFLLGIMVCVCLLVECRGDGGGGASAPPSLDVSGAKLQSPSLLGGGGAASEQSEQSRQPRVRKIYSLFCSILRLVCGWPEKAVFMVIVEALLCRGNSAN